ncbi:MAG: hypothetical protein RXP92_01335 [Candidatus Micrarchaeota archaeon]
MGFGNDLGLVWSIIRNPGKFAGKQMNYLSALKLYYEATIIPFILSLVVGIPIILLGVNIFLMPFSKTLISAGLTIAFIIGLAISLWIMVPIGIFINAFIYQIVGKYILNAWNKDYEKTFVATLFGTLPEVFLYWLIPIPLLNAVALAAMVVWSLIVLIISLSLQQKTSRINAFVAIVASVLFVIIIAFLFMALLYSMIIPAVGVTPHFV